MCEAIEYLKQAEMVDKRQEKKVRHKLNEIMGIAFFATLGNADNFPEIEAFGKEHEEALREYFELENGIPSHDTIERDFIGVSCMIDWCELRVNCVHTRYT